ncbi:FAD binding domain-containing protein [Bacillus sp. AGMB 02131]|uniref:FAD binding domain-containing protein n=1 Tax=Peribacillus faecalis TaxID=2772559 RepID=A0A927CT70_9BACI|nr:FAD binding domain-containing protein [Peribacillus faecalis]MBD3107417.1 FAD binding domain-containing protein [Peribacillus faecalis]
MIQHNEASALQSTQVWMPTSIETAIEQMSRLGSEARYISGGTLLQIQWESGHRIPRHLISLELIPSLKEIKVAEEGLLKIGALTTLAQCRKHSTIQTAQPILSQAVQSIAAPAVRSRATIGGNIMGGIGDLIPLLLALNAKLLVQGEEIEISNWLKSPVKNQLLTHILLPATKESSFFKKIGRRESFTAAIVTVAGTITKTDLGTIDDIRLAAGGGDNKPILLDETEPIIRGKRIEEIDWKAVFASIYSEFKAASDDFVSADYRQKAAANLIISELKNLLRKGGTVNELQ